MDQYINQIDISWIPLFDKWNDKLNEIIEKLNTFDGITNIYPPKNQIFRVFQKPVNDIQILIVGQDPYHQPNQANGLAFSVNMDVKIPPSLINIFKELKNEFPDRNYEFTHGDLSKWFFDENIFLLNASLSVIESNAGSFMKLWEPFTNDVIKYVVENNNHCVFLLWGNFAIQKQNIIQNNDRIVQCPHPSPLSAHRGFFGSNCFILIEQKLNKTINWQN